MKHIAKYILITVCLITTQITSQILNEGFENASQTWTQYQVTGNNGFNPTTNQANSGSYSAYSYTTNASFFGSTANEAWLISPKINLSKADGSQLSYYQRNVNPSGGAIADNPVQEVLYSTDYSGSGNPNTATWTVLNASTATTSWAATSITDQLPLQNNVYIAFRYVGSSYNFFITVTDRSWYVDDIELLSFPCAYKTVWQGGSWSKGVPNENTTAIIRDNYDTSTHGSFESCSLIIRKNTTVNIRANDYITVHNDLKVQGNLEVRHEGSLLMTDDAAIVNGNGTTNVHKTSNPLNLYDYTYYSSPVQNARVGEAFSSSPADNIFYYNPTAHDGSNNSGWQNAPSTSVLQPGVGYIAMSPTSGSFPQTQSVTFTGPVNNGQIQTSIGANSTGDNWNLIGNPYPSALSIDSLLAATTNSNLNKTVYVWTHNTDRVYDESGGFTYSTNDYASYTPIIGGTRAKSGGTKFLGHLASGQSFFINANTAGTVTFSNSMRNKSFNDQFFRAQPAKKQEQTETETIDRVWLNLTTSSGAFSQLLIGFSDLASNQIDPYDGPSLSSGYLSFYSIIEDKTFAINGMHKLDDDLVIPLGFTSYVASNTELSIEIDELNGQLNTEDYEVFLYDKTEGVYHDLKLEPYTFVVGEAASYKERFDLQLKKKTSLELKDEYNEKNILIKQQEHALIVGLDSGENIKKVKVYDIQGRILFDKSNSKKEYVLNTQGIAKGTVLIVQVWMSNDVRLSKKSILVK